MTAGVGLSQHVMAGFLRRHHPACCAGKVLAGGPTQGKVKHSNAMQWLALLVLKDLPG